MTVVVCGFMWMVVSLFEYLDRILFQNANEVTGRNLYFDL